MTVKLFASTLLLLLLSGCGGSESTSNTTQDDRANTETPSTDNGNTPTSSPVCSVDPIEDDTGFNDNPPADLPYEGGNSVQDIQDAFNRARAADPTITKTLVMPSQAIWDSMSASEQGLFLLNSERYDRGIKPFEGIDANVVNIAQNYAQTLYDKDVFDHNEDGSPFDRLNSVALIANNQDFFTYGENLAAFGSLPNYAQETVARSIYGWMYDDFHSGNEWGHRYFCLATGLQDNSGTQGEEGLIGFGVVSGDDYGVFEGYNSTIIVMNAFDPSSSWDHQNTQTVDLCIASDQNTANTPTDANLLRTGLLPTSSTQQYFRIK